MNTLVVLMFAIVISGEPVFSFDDAHNVLDDGADKTGKVSADIAITRALVAVKGSYSSTSGNREARALYFPAGTYIVSSKRLFRLLNGHSGLVIYGDGPYATIIKYTYDASEFDNFLFFHDESTDGTLQDVMVRDMGFIGPGSAPQHFGNFFYEKGSAASAGITLSNVFFSGFRTGMRSSGTGGTDTWRLLGLIVRDTWRVFWVDNSQGTPIDVIAPSITLGKLDTSSDVLYCDTHAACAWTFYGGYLGINSTNGAFVHYGSSFQGGYNNSNLTVIGSHIELLGSSSQLVNDESLNAQKHITFLGANADSVLPTAKRTTITLAGKSILNWHGGVLGGQVTLRTNEDVGNEPPTFILENARWDTGGAYVPPNLQLCQPNCTSISSPNLVLPSYSYRSVFVNGPGRIPDTDFGPTVTRDTIVTQTTSPLSSGQCSLSFKNNAIITITCMGTDGRLRSRRFTAL